MESGSFHFSKIQNQSFIDFNSKYHNQRLNDVQPIQSTHLISHYRLIDFCTEKIVGFESDDDKLLLEWGIPIFNTLSSSTKVFIIYVPFIS
jgi:hypothetical protein